MPTDFTSLVESSDPTVYHIQTHGPGPDGSLPLTPEMLLNQPSGDIFGLTQNAGMGWNPAELGRKEFLIISTQGGLRAPDGKPIAAGDRLVQPDLANTYRQVADHGDDHTARLETFRALDETARMTLPTG